MRRRERMRKICLPHTAIEMQEPTVRFCSDVYSGIGRRYLKRSCYFFPKKIDENDARAKFKEIFNQNSRNPSQNSKKGSQINFTKKYKPTNNLKKQF